MIDPDTADGHLAAELARTRALFDTVPNVFRVTANSTAGLSALNGLFECIRTCSIEHDTALLMGLASDPKAQAAIDLALELNRTHGLVDDALVNAARQAGFSAQGIIDLIMITTQNLITHMVNNVAGGPREYPEVPTVEE